MSRDDTAASGASSGVRYTAYIGIGANLGDRAATIGAAIVAIAKFGDVTAVSQVYETQPRHVEDQPSFLNACAVVDTHHEPEALLHQLLALESRLGRRREGAPRYGPRPIDLDLLMVCSGTEHIVRSADTLTLPHPRMTERRFVLVPLAEVAAHIVHPHAKITIRALLEACTDSGRVDLAAPAMQLAPGVETVAAETTAVETIQ